LRSIGAGGRARHRQKAIFHARETDITEDVIVEFERHAALAKRIHKLRTTSKSLQTILARASRTDAGARVPVSDGTAARAGSICPDPVAATRWSSRGINEQPGSCMPSRWRVFPIGSIICSLPVVLRHGITRRDLGKEEGRIVKIPAVWAGVRRGHSRDRAGEPEPPKESIEKLLRAAGFSESRRPED
jgi:hypothetical protein